MVCSRFQMWFDVDVFGIQLKLFLAWRLFKLFIRNDILKELHIIATTFSNVCNLISLGLKHQTY
jgi:hypothetical protein